MPGKSHGPRSLVGYSPWGRKESDLTERLHFTSLQAYNDSTTFVISRHTLHVKGERRLWAHQFSEAVASHSGLQMLNFSNILSEESPKIHCSTLKADAGDTSKGTAASFLRQKSDCISENLWQLGIVSPSIKEPMVAMYWQSVIFSGLVLHGKNQMNLPEVELQVLKFLNNLFCGILLNIFQNI